MDCPLPVGLDDGDMSWSDGHSMDSDDLQSLGIPQPPWMASLSATSVAASSSTVSFARTGQLSPISNGMDASSSGADSSASTSSSSASPPDGGMVQLPPPSVHPEAWALDYAGASHLAAITGRNDSQDDIAWEQGSDDILVAPKLEPLDDDDFCMDDLKEAPLTPIPASGHLPTSDQPRVKRPRGRPRKHPLTPNIMANKITKGRSKTGCLTCRKRKKKCDEAKPRCMNCEKNAVVCEGYPEKQIWKSGKEKAEEERMRSHSLPLIAMQPIYKGLETVEDMIFWKHYHFKLSTVLTVEGEHKNAFLDMMVPIATKHQGLMHSILSLASKHIDFDTPYGLNLLRDNPSTTAQALLERSLYHHDQARLKFYDDVSFGTEEPTPDNEMLVSARYGQMLCFLLEALAEGNPRGEHRLHLSAYQNLISSSPPADSSFLSFIAEFFQYHIFADELIHSAYHPDQRSTQKEPRSPIQIHPPRLLGVADGLLEYMSQITAIRNTIRTNMLNQVDPVVNYVSLYRAAEIDATIRDWTPHWPSGDSRERVALLYKQMAWIYLVRTIYPPSTSSASSVTSSTVSLPPIHSSPTLARSVSSAVNTPPQSASTSCASSPRLSGFGSVAGTNPHSTRHNTYPNPLSRKNSTASAVASADCQTPCNEGRPDSPPPIRRPPMHEHDPRITLAVDESLSILDTFKPSDPSQTLLLLPCFVIGTACFTPAQQERIRVAVKTTKGYTGLRNADRVMDVLEELWRLMGAGQWSAVWDWPSIARSLGLDFIPA
ncbi:fungal-specific transcription factor domain-containing protein [Immersiella caudata]|uniref:Fungal-specific transcription factor domain-containing protein n=1 Tax=Immersiella caudata TaxID=314043 RepID=A0AA39THK0_9PEZI|nr:fungal-specific transcription factor domain-containing protein [Immersiella caudata]